MLRDDLSKIPLAYRRIAKRSVVESDIIKSSRMIIKGNTIKSNITESSYVPLNPVIMDNYDRLYEQTHLYVNSTLSMKQFKHLANEKVVFNKYTTYNSSAPVSAYTCSCKILLNILIIAINSFFNDHKEMLYVPCHDHKLFSFCQKAYIFRYYPQSGNCSRFFRMNCINDVE